MPARVKAAASATNPFRFGRIVSGDAFTDREADLLALERELRGGQNVSFEAGSAGTPNLDALLEQIFQEPELIAREGKKKRVVVILDEFQDLMELGVTLLRQLRAVIQHQQHVSYAFLGSRQALLRRAVHERNAPLLKMARPYPLGPLPREEFANFLMARFRASGRPVPKEAVYALIDFTGAHPNDTQEAAHFLWEVALLPLSTTELVSTAISRVLDAEAAQMTVLWHDSAPAQRNLLVALVEWGGRNIYREEYRRSANLGPATT